MADVNAILTMLRSELGKPYVWGATGPSSFDCSGLVQYVYGQNGIKLPRTSEEQSKVGTTVPKGQQAPGDLVFSNWGDGPSSHVAVYIGNGQIIESPQPGGHVEISSLNANYLAHVSNIQRVSGLAGTPVTVPDSSGGGTDPFSGVTAALNSIGQSFSSISAVATSVNKLAMPEWWVRILAGIAGTALVFFGLWKLVGEVRN